ncbi:MAG: uracil-DNA glycosylase, partial [Pseudomonadota bacterium]
MSTAHGQYSPADAAAMLRWIGEAGVDTIVEESPTDWSLAPKAAKPVAEKAAPHGIAQPQASYRATPAASSSLQQAAQAETIAAGCNTLEDLRAAMEQFDGCALKRTAQQLVFADGPSDANLMLIGEAPGRDEDITGLPFVGAAGQLLNKILSAAGSARETSYITNLVPWRPPGNRKPTPLEMQICLPFLKRHIALKAPKVIVLLGATPVSALFATTDGITRLRGRWRELGGIGETAIPTMPTFHPAYLLRQP